MSETNRAQIFYLALNDEDSAAEKLEWLRHTKPQNLEFDRIQPDKNNNWINQTDNDWDMLLPLISKDKNVKTVFSFSTLGVSTNRDEWVYDMNKENLAKKMQFFIEKYNHLLDINDKTWNTNIKWSETLKNHFKHSKQITFDKTKMTASIHRPFIKQIYYTERLTSDRLTQKHYDMFGRDFDRKNEVIAVVIEPQIPFVAFSTNIISNMHLGGRQTQLFPRYRYDLNENRIDNLTDWGLAQLVTHYKDETITKDAIFDYIYAVLHNPAYRTKYELNLKREFPRIPFYDDFHKWAAWGKELMALHLEYETVEPYKELEIRNYELGVKKQIQTSLLPVVEEPQETPSPLGRAGVGFKAKIKVRLKANKDLGSIEIDDDTTIHGIPPEAWDYKLGNRSALEWILDQYKERKPTDPTILAHFDTYRFADYKTEVIDLLCRVCTVSVETVRITKKMQAL